MNKTFLAVPVVLAAFTLSGCTLTPQQAGGDQNVIPVPGGLVSKNVKGSVWKSEDGGQSFVVKSSVDATHIIDTAEILSVNFHPTKPLTIVLGTIDNGVFRTENGGETWTPIVFPPKRIYSFIIDRRDPDTRMFASGVMNGQGKIFRTDDSGANWKAVYTEPGSDTFVSALAQDPWNADIIYAGTNAGTLLRSDDAGDTWKNLGGKPEYGIVSYIVFDAKQRNSLSFLAYEKKTYHSSDGGNTWIDWDTVRAQEQRQALLKGDIPAPGGEATPGQILYLTADPTQSGVLFAGTSQSGVFRSDNKGKSWTKLNIIDSASKFPIRSIAIDPKNSRNIIFIAGKTTYRSTDAGATWSVTEINTDRAASVITYDPFDPRFLFLGLRNAK